MILERIVKAKQETVANLRAKLDLSQAEATIAEMPPAMGFAAALRRTQDTVALIAEVKKASPSKGVIRTDFDPISIALAYESAGAHAISVLTDEPFFQGHPDYLTQIRNSVRLPLLRKDFIIDEYQIYEARLLGADAILLIAGLLTAPQLETYRKVAAELGMDSLIEVHDQAELERALQAGATLIGINNRNLHTFEVKLETTATLAKELPRDILLVSESGIFTRQDVEYVAAAGAKAILVGESLMRADNLPLAINQLLGRPGV